MSRPAIITSKAQPLAASAEVGPHRFVVDEPKGYVDGAEDTGPSPHELLEAALGACTALTLRLYARRKGWPLEDAIVTVAYQKEGERLVRTLELKGPLTDEQKARLLEIANKCPVHKTLSAPVVIETALA